MASDSSEDDLLEVAAIGLLAAQGPVKKRRSHWVRPWIARRSQFGAYNSLMTELEAEDARAFQNFLRMSRVNFDKLLDGVSPLISKTDTAMRSSIPAGEKLAITLRYLATGDSYQSLEYLYRIPKNTICGFVPDVCTAIYESLKNDYMKVPTEEEWEVVIKGFEERWQFPHCLGALDGKHIAVRAPANSGSIYYNYKNFFSIVLLALVDASYKFIFVDVGANGRASDAGIFANSSLAYALEHNTLNIPPPTPLSGRQEPVPNVIVGDDAFPLKSNIMKPYPFRDLANEKKIFNYRLSRARRVSENAFGILVNRFAVFQRNLAVLPETCEKIVLACVALHNFLLSLSDTTYTDTGTSDIQFGKGGQPVAFAQQGGNRNTANARLVRDEFADFFCTNGQVEWQWDHTV